MSPENIRVRRKNQRRAWRGSRTGRRSTHQVTVTYGRQLRDQDWTAHWTRGDEAALQRYLTLPAGTQLVRPHGE